MVKSKLPSAIKIYKGLSIYRVNGQNFWYVRLWDGKRKKYLVKSTGFDNVIEAREAAKVITSANLKKRLQKDVFLSALVRKLETRLQAANQQIDTLSKKIKKAK